MRILRADVQKFLGMRALELDLDAGLVVVEGPNEAGKSTLLAFVQALLFPASTTAHTQVDGSIDLLDDELRYRVERRGGRATHRLIDLGTGEALDLARLATLTGNLDASVYRNVFAFGQAELQAFDALTDTAVKERLYSAAVAGAGRNAGAASRTLDEHASELLKPRSQATVLAGLAAELRGLNKVARQAHEEAHGYARLLAERDQAVAAADESSRSQIDATARRAWLENVLLVWPAWQQLETAKLALAKVAVAEAQLETADGDGPAPATWLRLASRVSGLASGLEAYEQTVGEVSTRQRELSDHVKALRNGLSQLGPSWSAERLARFDDGNEWRGRAEAAQAAIRHADDAIARLQGVRESAAGALAAAASRAAEARLERDSKLKDAAQRFSPDLLDQSGDLSRPLADLRGEAAARLQELNRLEDLTADLALARSRRAGALEQLQAAADSLQAGHWRHWLGWGIILAGTVGAVWLTWQANRTTALLVLALGATAATLLWPGRRHAGAGSMMPAAELVAHVHDLRAQELGFENRILDARAGLGLTYLDRPDAGTSDVRAAERQVEAQIAALDAARTALADHEVAKREEARLLHALEQCDTEAAQHEEGRDRAVDEWRTWCDAVGVPQGTTPVTLADLLNKVEALKQTQGSFKDVHAKLLEAMARADEYRARVTEVAKELGLSPTENDLPATVRAWISQVQAVEESRAELTEKRRRLVAQVTAADLELQTRFGADAARATSQLRQGDPVGWQSQLAEARELEERLAAQTKDYQKRTGALGEALERLGASSELVTNLEAADRVVTEIRAQARRWLVARLAKTLIDDTLREYERNKVPEVLRLAGRHLATMTGDRYVRVHVTEAEGLKVFTPRDEPKGTQELSRGTHEQLYLAVRLGLIESFSAANVALPLVMDDVLVNADPERAERMVRVVAQVAEGRQLLFLTCHPHLARLVLARAPAAKHVKLPAQLPADPQPDGVAG